MKIKVISIFLIAVFSTAVFAQNIHEPNSEIYRDIDRWTVQGYVNSFLPSVRPYPLPLIERILDEVIENGSEDAIQRAERYKTMLAPEARVLNPGVEIHAQGKNDEIAPIGSVYVEGLGRILDNLSVSYHASFFAITDDDNHNFNVPETYSPYPDFVKDTANIGPFYLRQQWTSLVGLGSDNIYFQAGLARSSFGPFFENGVVVGPQAPRAGHFSFTIWRPFWSYEILFQAISATDDFGLGSFANKYNVVHNIALRPTENFEIAFIQTITYGGRLELMYFVPFISLFNAQSIFGFEDNAFMGFHLQWRPINTFMVKAVAYVDDAHLNNMLTGSSIEAKASAQIGFSWAPRRGPLSRLDFDYTGVLPYMYTHWNQLNENSYNGLANSKDIPSNDDVTAAINAIDPYTNRGRRPNYLNYTHMGHNIGPDLQPNSDRFSIRSTWDIIPSVRLNVCGYLTRHGNASRSKIVDGIMDDRWHDGSIFDDGRSDAYLDDEDRPRKQSYGFDYWLTQNTLDVRLGGTIAAEWTIPTAIGTFRIIGEYGAEYGWNRYLTYGNDGFDQYWSIGFAWRW